MTKMSAYVSELGCTVFFIYSATKIQLAFIKHKLKQYYTKNIQQLADTVQDRHWLEI